MQSFGFRAAVVRAQLTTAELKIVRDFESTRFPPELLYLSRIDCRQFVAQFLRRWQDWLEHDYVPREWHEFSWSDDDEPEFRARIPDPRTIDISVLERFAQSPD